MAVWALLLRRWSICAGLTGLRSTATRAVEAFLSLRAVEGLVAVELVFHGVIKVLANLVDAAFCKGRPFFGHCLASEPLRCF